MWQNLDLNLAMIDIMLGSVLVESLVEIKVTLYENMKCSELEIKHRSSASFEDSLDMI